LRDRNPRRLLRHTPPGTRTVLGPTVRRPPTFRQSTVRVSSFSHHQPAVMAITKWSIQAPSSKKSPAEAAAAALRKKSPAEAGPSVRVVSLRKEGLWVFRSGTMRQFGPRGLVPWRQTLGARVLPRSNRRRVGHVQSSQRKLIERRIIAKAVLGVEKAPPLWESGAFRVMPLAEGFPSSAAGQFGTPGFGSAWPERKAPPKRGKDHPGRKIKMKRPQPSRKSRLF
jgi:hypothetical protein